MSSTVFYSSHLGFLSGPTFIQDTGSRWTVGIVENESSLDPRRSELSHAPLHASMRAFETPERLLTLDGGERYKESYPVPDDLLINRRGLALALVSRVTKFHLSDSYVRECTYHASAALLCSSACVYPHTWSTVYIREYISSRCTGIDRETTLDRLVNELVRRTVECRTRNQYYVTRAHIFRLILKRG